MNRNILAAAVFAALAGLALPGGAAGQTAGACAVELADLEREWSRRERWAHDPYVVNLHIRAAEKAMREGDTATCLSEVSQARVQMLADEPERSSLRRR